MQIKIRNPFIQSIWFKLLLLIVFFIPPYSQIPYPPIDTAEVIASVMAQPVIEKINLLLPIAKFFLLIMMLIPFLKGKLASHIFMGYISFILIIVAFFQNMSFTQNYGFVWLIGNTVIILIAAAVCIYDLFKQKTILSRENLQVQTLWVLAPMLLAFLMPYGENEQDVIQPAFGLSVLTNEAGVTYCMITPIIIGVMILFSKDVYPPTLSIISFIGFIFGMMNILTWFVFQNQNWWMGILHLPLVILSFYALLLSRRRFKSLF